MVDKSSEMIQILAPESIEKRRQALGLVNTYEHSGLFDLSPADGVNRVGKRTRRGSGGGEVRANMKKIYGNFKEHIRDDQVLSAADMFDPDFYNEMDRRVP